MAGANAADKIITSANTCTVDVLGVSDNNATANTIATWDLKDYECPAGQYLLETETNVECTECPTGSYCPGGTYTVESENNGKNTCPTTHPNSATGAGADTQCYTACTVDMVAKATAVTGNDYYGTGVDTCEPTACVAGWHVKPGLGLMEIVGVTEATGSTCNNNNGEQAYSFGINASDAGIAGDPMAFAVAYGDKGIITGHGRCSRQAGINNVDTNNILIDITIVDSLADETGQDGAQYCYCQLDGYKTSTGKIMSISSAPWVFYYDFGSADLCANRTFNCAEACTNVLSLDAVDEEPVFIKIFDTVGSIMPATCAANTINIDWNPDNNGEHIKNMCTYEGSITVPSDPVKPGYTFMGWKLVE